VQLTVSYELRAITSLRKEAQSQRPDNSSSFIPILLLKLSFDIGEPLSEE
jgi:hypothetical protein